jgi:HTH-type transcriptional regulator / antitoxin HigA
MGEATTLEDAKEAWPAVAKVVAMPRNDAEYDQLVTILDQLIDQVGNDEDHPLASLMEIIGILIEKYEDEHIPEL